MNLKTVIVDDEQLARQIIEEYVSKIKSLELVLSTGNPLEFINYSQTSEVDLIFLDIEMPEVNGMEILRSLVKKPKVILTTAYSEFALESYDHGVIDYLLKPIKLERFLKAINRVTEIEAVEKVDVIKEIQIKHDGIPVNLPLKNIRYIQSFGNYLRIYTDARMYLITETLSNMAMQLPDSFQRTHKSYIANLNKVEKSMNDYLVVNGSKVPLSAMYKIVVREKLNSLMD